MSQFHACTGWHRLLKSLAVLRDYLSFLVIRHGCVFGSIRTRLVGLRNILKSFRLLIAAQRFSARKLSIGKTAFIPNLVSVIYAIFPVSLNSRFAYLEPQFWI